MTDQSTPDQSDQSATARQGLLERKRASIALREKLYDEVRQDELKGMSLAESNLSQQESLDVWGGYKAGQFANLDYVQLRWHTNNIMEFIPDPEHPFQFTDSTGYVVRPRQFFTDGATIPSFATGLTGISRWQYGPAILIHDWEYAQHHCKSLPSNRDRKRVDDALMEALKTLMIEGQNETSYTHFWAIQFAVRRFGWIYWNASAPCTLT